MHEDVINQQHQVYLFPIFLLFKIHFLLCFQDYNTFFDAVECEALFRYLDLTPPPHEVEAQLEGGILDILCPSGSGEEEKVKVTEVTEHIAHLQPTEMEQQIARHKPTETALWLFNWMCK